MSSMFAFLLVLTLWSALMTGARRLIESDAVPQDRAEKVFLALCLAPLVVWPVLRLAAQHVAIAAPLPVQPFADAWAAGAQQVQAVVSGPRSAGIAVLLANGLARGLIWSFAGVSAFMLARWLAGVARMVRICAAGQASELAPDVAVSSRAATPFAWGRGGIVLPSRLVRDMDRCRIALILRHEREHLRRGDPLWFLALSFIDAVFWFNPFILRQTRRCRLAAELACDAAIAAADPALRRLYAETLIEVLKTAAGEPRPYAPAAFSTVKPGDNAVRLLHIMRPPAQRRIRLRPLCAMAAILFIPFGAVSLAWSQAPARAALARLPVVGGLAALPAMIMPDMAAPDAALGALPMSGALVREYGMQPDPVTHKSRLHQGIDIGAPGGTPVHAAAGGKVVFAGNEGLYHKTVEIDHGNGLKTRYAQLGRIDVHWGDTVAADQVIGASGKDNGAEPHLHFEVWRGGRSMNPLLAYAARFSGDSARTRGAPAVHASMRVGERQVTADRIAAPPKS